MKPVVRYFNDRPWLCLTVFIVLLFGVSLGAWVVFYMVSREIPTQRVSPAEVRQLLEKQREAKEDGQPSDFVDE